MWDVDAMLLQMTSRQLDEWMAAARLDNLLCDPTGGRGLPDVQPEDEKDVVASPNQSAQLFKAITGA